ncbi:MAG: hypothetical protein PWQ57_785 [Desulfovibrionales bacterium]|jgi:hypothetical protein|nr:hypothetical protein [Desulfovibrionales bacterium]
MRLSDIRDCAEMFNFFLIAVLLHGLVIWLALAF